MAEEQLIIEVKYEDHNAKKQIDDLTSSVNALNAATTGKGFKSLGHVAKNLAAITTSASNLDGIGKKLSDLSVGATKVFDTFKSFDPKAYSNNIKALTSAINSISTAVGNLSSKGSGLKAVSDALKQLPSAANKDIGKKTNLSGAANSAKIASKMFKDLGNNIKTVAKAGWQLSKLPFKMILSPIQKVGQGLIGMTNRFTTFLKGIGRIALYRAIRTGIKMVTSAVREGVNNLYIWAGMVGNSFKPTMDSLATSFLYLKNSIGAAVSPLLDALAPALETVVNQIVDVLNIFNQVIATMTGATTWRKALRAPASYADNISGLGHDAEDANDAVKELKRTILGFDEINRLEDKTKTLTPKQNGKDPTGYYAKQGAFSFTEVPISQTALDIAKMLKDAWAKGDFTSIGDMIGEKVGTALLRVPWEKEIQPTVKKLASSFGTLLSGMFDYNGTGGKKMWDGIAYTVYNALNTAILGYVTFFDSVKWEGIGEGIGAALKKVCKNIKWDWMAEALTKFPNAIIDSLTGFTKQFTTQDFYELGQNVGRTVSKAISEIKWGDLFKNTFKIATGIVAAFNGALTGFDWSSVKGAILGGIKKIPAKSWSDLGVEIGQAIFNVAVFVANLVDTLVRFIKLGNWGALFDGIKTGITNGLKQYGGWTGVAKKLGEWIPENIGTISIILALAVGLPLLKALPSAFATTVMNALNLKKVPGTGMTLGAWLKAVTLAAGVIVAVHGISTILGHDFKKSSVGDNVLTLLKGAGELGAAGAGIGFTFGGPPGALIGALTGAAISLGIGLLKWTCDAGIFEKLDEKLFKAFGNFSIGALKFMQDAGKFVLKVSMDLEIEKILPKIAKGAVQLAKDTWEGSMLQGMLREIFGTGATISADDYEGAQHAWDKVDDDTLAAAFGGNGSRSGSVVAQESHRVGAADNRKGITLPIFPTIKKLDVEAAWKQLTQWWGEITKTNTVTQFSTKGLNNQSKSWLSQLTGWWNIIVGGNNVKEFTTKGLNNQSGSWWSQLTGWWNAIVGLNKAKEFQTTGVKNQSGSWWRQLTGWWNEIVNNNKAKDFRVDVKDDSSSWWRSVKRWWSEVTSGNSLKSTVSIDNAYNAFVSAWNTMQRSFNNHPLTAYVKTVQTGTSVGGNIKGALTGSSGTVVNTKTGKSVVGSNGAWNIDITSFLTGGKRKKASGGIYKDGQWHDVTAFAAGGSPMSGQMFIAREAGPELVGTIGGNTAVVNNDQIVSSVAAGVAQAVASVLGNGGNTNDITIKVDSEVLYRAVKKGERMASGRYGTAIAIG